MSRVGVTGHRNLDPEAVPFVTDTLHDLLKPLDALVGITSLAIGADQLFAKVVLALGGMLEVVVPSQTYDETFTDRESLVEYKMLIARASEVTILPYQDSSEAAFFSGGQAVVQRSDYMVAVWDGQPAKGLGGTGDIVKYCLDSGKDVIHINPNTHTVNKLDPSIKKTT